MPDLFCKTLLKAAGQSPYQSKSMFETDLRKAKNASQNHYQTGFKSLWKKYVKIKIVMT